MTKTTNLCLFLAITAILIVSPLASESVFADPNHEGKKDKKSKTGEHKLKCKSIGSWFNPEFLGLVISSSEGKCSAGLGKVTSAAITVVSPIPTSEGCLVLSTAPLLDDNGNPLVDFSMGKKGFIEYTSTATQCFNDVDGVPLGIAWDGSFCKASAGSAYTSTVTGTYTILDGLVKDTPVVGGSGTIDSEANHCDNDAPYGNSFTTDLRGSIIFPELEI